MDAKIIVMTEVGCPPCHCHLADWPRRDTLLHVEIRVVLGAVKVTYMLLKSVYSIMNTYTFPLVQSRVQCKCHCPGDVFHS